MAAFRLKGFQLCFQLVWCKFYACSRAPLHFAAASGHLDIVMKLVEYNADVNIEENSGKNAYDLAVIYSNTDVADYLMSLF